MTTYNADAPVLNNYHAVVLAFSDFLTVAIHTILYERNIYPQSSFLAARKFNCPVRQSRHPKVCQWIQDAVAAVEVEMLKVSVESSSVCCALCLNYYDRTRGHKVVNEPSNLSWSEEEVKVEPSVSH